MKRLENKYVYFWKKKKENDSISLLAQYYRVTTEYRLKLFYKLEPNLTYNANFERRRVTTADLGYVHTNGADRLTQTYNQQTKGSNSARQTRDTTTKTRIVYGHSTRRASKYKVYKLHQRYFLNSTE